MENYREKLKLSSWVTGVCIVVLAIFSLIVVLAEFAGLPLPSPVAGDSHWHSRWRGFCAGAACGIMGIMICSLVRNLQALKNDKKLKKLYIKEHDERSIQIWTAARAAGMQAFLLVGLIAVILAGFFSVTVSLTLLASVFISSVITIFFKLYYSKKY